MPRVPAAGELCSHLCALRTQLTDLPADPRTPGTGVRSPGFPAEAFMPESSHAG